MGRGKQEIPILPETGNCNRAFPTKFRTDTALTQDDNSFVIIFYSLDILNSIRCSIQLNVAVVSKRWKNFRSFETKGHSRSWKSPCISICTGF